VKSTVDGLNGKNATAEDVEEAVKEYAKVFITKLKQQ